MSKITKAIKLGSTVLAAAGGVAGATEVVNTVVERYDINQVHEINYSDVYLINGVEVTSDEFNGWLDNQKKEDTPKQIILTQDNLDIDGVARVADYLDFEFNGTTVYAAKVISDKVARVHFNYSEAYLSYVEGETYNSPYPNVLYQDVNKEDGYYFTVGCPVVSEYQVLYETDLEVGEYVFYISNNPSFAPVKFSDFFDSIEITLE